MHLEIGGASEKGTKEVKQKLRRLNGKNRQCFGVIRLYFYTVKDEKQAARNSHCFDERQIARKH
jgi:hypothetical protein